MRSPQPIVSARRLFATKPQLAGALLDCAHVLGIRAAFVAGDEVYGGRQLRRSIRERGMGYVLAVRANHVLTAGSGRAMTAAAAAGLIPARAWQRMPTGSGSKGIRHYDWAMLEVASDDTPGGHGDGHGVLLVRRHRYTGTLSYYRCWTPGPVPLSRLIAVASARWRIEEDHQLSKQAAGLDAGQVIRWKSWHRWTAICLLAYIYLGVAVALQREQDAGSDLDAGLIPVTVPELLRLLRDTVIPPPRRDRAHRLHWSDWRRRHQHRARQAHQRWNAYAEATP
jgi:SRSO17 transposase